MKLFAMVTTKYSERYTWLAIQTFFQFTPLAAEDRFILIDNDGTFDTTAAAGRYPRLEFLINAEPKSFAANVNFGLAQARIAGADLYQLNNDLVFSPGWLEPLAVDDRAIISPVCNMQFEYRHKDLHCRLTMEINDYLGKEQSFVELVELHRARHSGYKLEHSYPFYCVKIPRQVYEQIGDFDEAYGFAGFEDTDYILRCYLAGIPICFALGSFVLHFYGKSSWRVEADDPVRQQLAKDNQQGERLFEQRWGKTLLEIFCKQLPQSLAKLRALEEQSKIKLYGDMIRKLRPGG